MNLSDQPIDKLPTSTNPSEDVIAQPKRAVIALRKVVEVLTPLRKPRHDSKCTPAPNLAEKDELEGPEDDSDVPDEEDPMVDLFDDEVEAAIDAAEAEDEDAELLLNHHDPFFSPTMHFPEPSDDNRDMQDVDDDTSEFATPSDSSDSSSDEEFTPGEKRPKNNKGGRIRASKRRRVDSVSDHSETQPIISTRSHQYMGTCCSCTEGSHTKDESLQDSSPLHLDKSCAIMKALNLSFNRKWRFIICCKSFVPLSKLRGHFVTYHQELLPELLPSAQPMQHGNIGRPKGNRHFKVVEDHLSEVLNIPITQTAQKFEKGAAVDGPIAGIADTVEEAQCPTCQGLYGTRESLRVHYTKKCKTNKLSFISRDTVLLKFHTQRPFALDRNGGPRVIVLDPNPPRGPSSVSSGASSQSGQTVPPPQRYTVPKGKAAPPAPWLDIIGWPRWVDGRLGDGWSVAGLIDLATPPKHMKTPPMEPDRRQTLAWAGNRVLVRLTRMASDANKWLDSCNLELRQDLTVKYVPFDT